MYLFKKENKKSMLQLFTKKIFLFKKGESLIFKLFFTLFYLGCLEEEGEKEIYKKKNSNGN